MAFNWTTEWPGVYARHAAGCPLRNGGECTCPQITYRAAAKTPDGRSRVVSPDFASAIEARDWLRDQRERVTAAVALSEEGPALGVVIQDFLAAADRGDARDRNGVGYTRERLAEIRDGLSYVDAHMGRAPIQAVRRRNVQALVDGLHAAGLSSERVIAVVGTLRELFIYAIQRELVDFNPIVQLRLPADDDLSEARAQAASYPSGQNGNGESARAAADASVPTAPYVAPFAAAVAAGPAGWAPGIAEGDDPDRDEPPRVPWIPQPAAAPAAPTSSAMPDPYDAPMFTPQGAPVTLPIGAATQYGTPAYGTQALAAQPTMQAPLPQQAQPTLQVQPRDADDGVLVSEQMFWWITRIVVIVFVLIALVLVAESV
jgi:hypothetical protein